jgi:uncharacterized membrane protein
MKIVIVLISGAVIGFLVEFSYRSLKKKRVVFPSIYSLIMYIITALLVYLTYLAQINFFIKTVLMIIITTGLEFLVGYYLKTYKKFVLWDYSDRWFNYQGIICPQFSLYWLLISLFYYFIVIPFLIKL